jgi:hypothetical protein|tara:strand:- start:977 stop:1789 length:813 start_codon:yes stop_codon:yes gene_type:complete
MTLLVSGCSFTYGDELLDPQTERWSTHLGELLKMDVINVAANGNSNKAIWRSVKEQLLNDNNITHAIIIWSAIERIEVLKLDYHIQYNLDDGDSLKNTDIKFRTNNPFIQLSPSRIDVHPYRLISEETTNYYNEMFSVEGAILDTFFYMKDVYNTCNMLGIKSYGGIFHQAVNMNIAKTFTAQRLKNYGDRLGRVHDMYQDIRRGLEPKQKIGFTEPNPSDIFARERPQYLSFNEFTETHKYDRKEGGHPGPEAHKGYAEYLFEEIFNNE